MDYKYIEQLLERYWECETTLEEERLLRDFFMQKQLPAHLERYRSLFDYESAEQSNQLGDDFDKKMLGLIDETEVKAVRNSIIYRLQPFYRAAAVVAIIFTLGMAAQHSFSTDSDSPEAAYNYADFKDSYTDPKVAYEEVASALKEVSDGLKDAGLQCKDSANYMNNIQ